MASCDLTIRIPRRKLRILFPGPNSTIQVKIPQNKCVNRKTYKKYKKITNITILRTGLSVLLSNYNNFQVCRISLICEVQVMTINTPNITSGHVLHVGGLVLSVGGFYSLSRELLLYSCSCAVLVFLAPAAPKAPQQIQESRRSAPSALRRDGDFFNFDLYIFDHYFCQ